MMIGRIKSAPEVDTFGFLVIVSTSGVCEFLGDVDRDDRAVTVMTESVIASWISLASAVSGKTS